MRFVQLSKFALIVTLPVALMSSGCFQTANLQDLKDRVLKSYTTSSPERLYYIGSDNNYDYYFMEKEGQRYRIPQSQSLRDDRMNLTSDRAKWQVVSPVSRAEAVGAEGSP
ncbi:MAG TPA: hypothetical protein VLJ39_20470 [Tepidisphaeraceae bacterium]|jgi:hypothetical protein|nr:hypothetical protein [Tepidisphaeraceae bacterium]